MSIRLFSRERMSARDPGDRANGPGAWSNPLEGSDTMKRTCSVEGCDETHLARGWCLKHYRRWERHGAPTITLYERPRGSLANRFWAKVLTAGPDDCWVWMGARTTSGYGAFDHDGAHRVAYLLSGETIPDGYEIDHECHNRDLSCPGGKDCPHRLCVNPAHLVPRTRAENQRRRNRRARTPVAYCPRGHEYTPENTRYSTHGSKVCIVCQRAANRRYKAKAKSRIESERVIR